MSTSMWPKIQVKVTLAKSRCPGGLHTLPDLSRFKSSRSNANILQTDPTERSKFAALGCLQQEDSRTSLASGRAQIISKMRNQARLS